MHFKRISTLQILILVGAVGVPLFALLFFMYSPMELRQYFFLFFMVGHSCERVWETFYTTKERHALKLHGDWSLVATTIFYILLCLISMAEAFFLKLNFSNFWIFFGLMLYFFAFRLRWWGMKALGSQWAVHAVGAQKVKKVRVIKLGPYKYIRHPIYLAIFLEVLSIPIIMNSTYGCLFAIFCYIPLQYIRLLAEEKNNIRKLGNSYLKYMQETSAVFPIKFFLNFFHEDK